VAERRDCERGIPAQSPGTPAAGLEVRVPSAAGTRWWARAHWAKLALLIASLYLFVLAIALMKEGARGMVPLVRTSMAADSVAKSLGFGWLLAYIIMSGSPVAAAALTFFDAGALDQLGAFAMITGSRLGAGFIVLAIGLLYVLRGRDRVTSLSMGLLSLIVTATTYVPGLVLGAFLLRSGSLDGLQLSSGALVHSVLDLAVTPVTGLVVDVLPRWASFVIGLGVIIISFSLFDRCLPEMTIKESQLGWTSRLVYRPWVMFLLGGAVTLLSMSVSLSLAILVPLSSRGFVRRENVTPYIMGANITTFIDTLLAAVLLNNPRAFTIVLVEMVSITVISIAILALAYRPYQAAMLRLVTWVTSSTRHLVWFVAILFGIPVLLILL
jgi:sodium-dependent phosphate cotransporter